MLSQCLNAAELGTSQLVPIVFQSLVLYLYFLSLGGQIAKSI